jgi:hypothetical protein
LRPYACIFASSTGVYNAPGLDRDNQIGTGSTDLILGGFHRGMLSGDNAWQYFSQIRYQQPFLYRSAADPQGFFDGNLGVVQTYKPAYQLDGAAGIVYNNLYNVLGLDKITPLFQLIARTAITIVAMPPIRSIAALTG